MNRSTAHFTSLAMLLLATTVACDKSADKAAADQAKADSAQKAAAANAMAGMTPEAKVALDSGNVLYRAGSAFDKTNAKADAKKSYEAALVQYRLAARGSTSNAAPLVGVYMCALVLNNKTLADSSYAELKARGAAPPPGAMHSAEPAPTKAPGKVHGGSLP